MMVVSERGAVPGAAPGRQVRVVVLFMDVVRFSTRAIPEQVAIVKALNDFVTDTQKILRPDASPDELLFIPTGDGMAIAFLSEDALDQPVRWAWAISRKLDEWNASQPTKAFEMRMGMHSQRVEKTFDPYGRPNVAGPGINNAQRVMDCGEAKHILASHTYADDLRDHSEALRPLMGSSYELPIKHRGSIRVFNLVGELDGFHAGNATPPKAKPSVDLLPKDLQDTLLLMGDISKERDRGKGALALCLFLAHRRRLEDIRHAWPVQTANGGWGYVFELLSPFESEDHSYIELTSVIPPQRWATETWRSYEAQILRISSSPHSFARRLHVMEEKDLQRNLQEITALMLAEFICSVRVRVLAVPKGEVVRISNDEEFQLGHKWNQFALFDCGTYYRAGGHYSVIFSNIEPYFLSDKAPDAGFAVYAFGGGDQSRYVYEELRANFFRGWHNLHDGGRVLTLCSILEHAQHAGINVYQHNRIKQYVPTTVDLVGDFESKLRKVVESVTTLKLTPQKMEDQLAELLPTLRTQ